MVPVVSAAKNKNLLSLQNKRFTEKSELVLMRAIKDDQKGGNKEQEEDCLPEVRPDVLHMLKANKRCLTTLSICASENRLNGKGAIVRDLKVFSRIVVPKHRDLECLVDICDKLYLFR